MTSQAIIYGAGDYGISLYHYLKARGLADRVGCICDRAAGSMQIPDIFAEDGKKIVTFEEITDLDCEFIIAVQNYQNHCEIADLLASANKRYYIRPTDWLESIGIDLYRDIDLGLCTSIAPEIISKIVYMSTLSDRSPASVRSRVCPEVITGRPSKIKVRILYLGGDRYNSIESLLEYFASREDTELALVIDSMWNDDRQADRLNAIRMDASSYDIEHDRPNIVIITRLYGTGAFRIFGGPAVLRARSAYIALLPFDHIRIGENTWFDSYDNADMDALHYDALIVGRPLFDYLSSRYPNVRCFNNPKMDSIRRAMSSDTHLPSGWEKLKGRKIVLGATTHPLYVSGIITDGTCIDSYMADVCRYFQRHEELGLIFRPHRMLLSEYKKGGVWTDSDIEDIKRYFADSPNMVWDDTSDYSSAFSISDALITDTRCGILFSYLPTKRPICLMSRSKYEVWDYNHELTKHYYRANSMRELEVFFEMLAGGGDPLYADRMKTLEEYIPDFDGKCGERIGEFIINDYLRKVGKKAE